jgi:predicted nucleic acid-binding protein
MSKTLFVDTNIFLTLYAFSDDDIEQFRRLFVLAQEGEIDFLLPQQVIDEFWRNREATIAQSLAPLQSRINPKLPAPIRELPEATKLISAQKDYEKHRASLIKSFLTKSSAHELMADKLVIEIFEKSTVIEVTAEILGKAQRRIVLGNPPGKSGSYGDAINWECILSHLGLLDNLFFVSKDTDYSSSLHDGEFNEFLQRELMNSMITTVSFFGSLRAFMSSQFPDVEIDAFTEASEAVQSLEESGSFASTHGAIARLASCNGFSNKQIHRLVTAAEENSQVGAIVYDQDLDDFYSSLLGKYGDKLGSHWKDRLLALVSHTADDEKMDEDIIPF